MNHVATVVHALRRWLQDHARRTLRLRWQRDCARRQPRQERHQRRLPLQQGPLRLRLRQQQRTANFSAGPQGRQAHARQLGRGSDPSPVRGSASCAMQRARTPSAFIGSNRTTNEENYLLQKFARTVHRHEQHRPPPHGRLRDTRNLSRWHHHTPAGKTRFASQHCVQQAPALLIVGGDPTNEGTTDGLEHSHERPLEQGPCLHRQPQGHQAQAPGEGVYGSRRVRLRRLHRFACQTQRPSPMRSRPKRRSSSSSVTSFAVAS